MAQKQGKYPSGLSEDRLSEGEIRQIADFYESLTEAEWIAHYEADYVQEGLYASDNTRCADGRRWAAYRPS